MAQQKKDKTSTGRGKQKTKEPAGSKPSTGTGTTNKATGQKKKVSVSPVVYAFDSKKRCPRSSGMYPAFLNKSKCGGIMKSVKLVQNTKHWVCPECGYRALSKGWEI